VPTRISEEVGEQVE
jgi:hypothetical protein